MKLPAASPTFSPPLNLRALYRECESFASLRSSRHQRNRLATYQPYARQRAFHEEGALHRERLLMAGNQLGKSYCGAAEMAIHLTGRYPDWWRGRRFSRPIRAWAGSVTRDVTRDGVQRILIGEPKDESRWGTGLVPGAAIAGRSRAQGVRYALDSVLVRHVSGGHSTLGFKSYDQGRAKWQAETLDLVWFDEEPPLEIYSEGLTRTSATGGMVYLTFTPLLGLSEVVHMFVDDCGLT
jgi:phage terminase large subunit-like protein